MILLGFLYWVLDFGFGAIDKANSNLPVVFVSKVKSSELFDLLSFPARVSSKINSAVVSETEGFVSKILANMGTPVSRGQKLMVIKNTDPVHQFAPFHVLAPVSGVVSIVNVSEGGQILKGQQLFSITNPDLLKISIEIPSQDKLMIFRNTKGDFQIDRHGPTYRVKVSGVSGTLDPGTGSYTCELELVGEKKTKPHLSPGMLGRVQFQLGLRRGISIPDHAVFYKGKDPQVRVMTNGRAKVVPVQLGRRQFESVEILSGLTEDAILIERVSRYLAENEEVIIQNPESITGNQKK